MKKMKCRHCGESVVYFAPLHDLDNPYLVHERTRRRKCAYQDTEALL